MRPPVLPKNSWQHKEYTIDFVKVWGYDFNTVEFASNKMVSPYVPFDFWKSAARLQDVNSGVGEFRLGSGRKQQKWPIAYAKAKNQEKNKISHGAHLFERLY